MTQGTAQLIKSRNSDFQSSALELSGEDCWLKPENSFLYSGSNIPGFEFSIFVGEEFAGTCTALIESDFRKIAEEGNVGIELERKFYGTRLPSKITRALYPFFVQHGQTSILLTFDQDNRAIEKACQELGASDFQFDESQRVNPGKMRCTVSTLVTETA